MADFNRDIHCLLGLPFDALTLEQTIEQVRRAASGRQRCFVSTPNLNFLNGCLADREFRASVINSDLSIADGMPLVWVARLLGIPIPERVAGAGLFEALRHDPARPMSVFLFGGEEGVVETASRLLNDKNSGLICVGHHYPGFGSIAEMSSAAIIERINASGADFLIVALGARKGQAWIEHNRARLTVPIISHLGAVVNFAAGTVRRAPSWMQRSGLEWLWRVKEEPKLWWRYLKDGVGLLRLLITRVLPLVWYQQRTPLPASELANALVWMEKQEDSLTICLKGAWVRENLAALRKCLGEAENEATRSGRSIRLDLSEVTRVDSAFVGLLMLLHGYQTARGKWLLVKAPRREVRRLFKYTCAEFVLNGRRRHARI